MDFNLYRFTSKAENDLDEILEYISSNLANPPAAKSFYEDLFSKIELICHFPESCEKISNKYVKINGVRKVLVNNYVVYYVYEPKEKLITIIRIVYGRRNLEEIINAL